jgi:hypothetical protein
MPVNAEVKRPHPIDKDERSDPRGSLLGNRKQSTTELIGQNGPKRAKFIAELAFEIATRALQSLQKYPWWGFQHWSRGVVYRKPIKWHYEPQGSRANQSPTREQLSIYSHRRNSALESEALSNLDVEMTLRSIALLPLFGRSHAWRYSVRYAEFA